MSVCVCVCAPTRNPKRGTHAKPKLGRAKLGTRTLHGGHVEQRRASASTARHGLTGRRNAPDALTVATPRPSSGPLPPSLSIVGHSVTQAGASGPRGVPPPPLSSPAQALALLDRLPVDPPPPPTGVHRIRIANDRRLFVSHQSQFEIV